MLTLCSHLLLNGILGQVHSAHVMISVFKTLIDKLKDYNDPRLPIYAQLPSDATVTTYQGAANGLSADQANSQGFNKLLSSWYLFS